GSQVPAALRTSPRIMGRNFSSSQGNHSPSIRIDARHFLYRNVMHKPPLVLRVRNHCLAKRISCSFGDEQFLTSNAYALSAMPSINLSRVQSKPFTVSIKLLALYARSD